MSVRNGIRIVQHVLKCFIPEVALIADHCCRVAVFAVAVNCQDAVLALNVHGFASHDSAVGFDNDAAGMQHVDTTIS